MNLSNRNWVCMLAQKNGYIKSLVGETSNLKKIKNFTKVWNLSLLLQTTPIFWKRAFIIQIYFSWSLIDLKKKKAPEGGWDGSDDKGVCSHGRGPEFGPQDPHSARKKTLLQVVLWLQHVYCMFTHITYDHTSANDNPYISGSDSKLKCKNLS